MSHTIGDRYNYRFKVVMNNDIHVHVFAHMCNIVHTCTCTCMYMYLSRVQSVVGSSPTRGSSFFLGKVTALGVLCCFALLFVCSTLLASFFLPSHL